MLEREALPCKLYQLGCPLTGIGELMPIEDLDRKVAVLESDIKHLVSNVQDMRQEIRAEFMEVHEHMVSQDRQMAEMKTKFDQAEGAKKLIRVLWIIGLAIAGLFGYHVKP